MERGMKVHVVALLGAVLGAIGCGGGGKTTTILLMNEMGGA